MAYDLRCGDCLQILPNFPADSIDLCFFSPPYTLARLYLENGQDLGIARDSESWATWMLQVFKECSRVCKGLIACVCEGQTKKFRWDAAPVLLMADLHRAGLNLRRPAIFHRVGIPGSGGPDWLRADTEFIVCVTRPGKLPWSDNTAMGHEPKLTASAKTRVGILHRMSFVTEKRPHTKSRADGSDEVQNYNPPAVANPGNMIVDKSSVVHCVVGGGRMGGDEYASQNEAPFPESLTEFFIRSFCPPGGTVLDPFVGSGTTVAVAERLGRNGIGIDIRQSQIDLATRRCQEQGKLGLFEEKTNNA